MMMMYMHEINFYLIISQAKLQGSYYISKRGQFANKYLPRLSKFLHYSGNFPDKLSDRNWFLQISIIIRYNFPPVDQC